MTDQPTQGVHHLGLTVPDLDPPRRFLVEALGFREVGSDPGYPAVFLSDGTVTLTLWRAVDPGTAVPFDRKRNVGLHHVALKVADQAALQRIHGTAKAWPGFVVEVAPEPPRARSAARHFIGAIPGGLRFEFFANPPARPA